MFHTTTNAGNERRRELTGYPIINVSRIPWDGILKKHQGVIYIVCELKVNADGTVEETYRIANSKDLAKLGQMGGDAVEGKNLEGLTISQAWSERYTDLSATTYAWVLVGVIIFDKDRKNIHTRNLPTSKIDDNFRDYIITHDNRFSKPTESENKEKLIGFDPFNSEHVVDLRNYAIQFFDGCVYLASRAAFSFLPHQGSIDEEVRGKIDDVMNRVSVLEDLISQAKTNIKKEYHVKKLERARKTIHILLSSFTGSGKSYMSPHFFARYVNPTDEVALFTTPEVDTVRDIISAITELYYGIEFEIIDKEVIRREGDNILPLIQELQRKGVLVVIILSVQHMRRGEKEDDGTPVLAEEVAFVRHLSVGMWIRDERHKQYEGPVTKKVLGHIVPRILLDLTATPYKELELGYYAPNEIVARLLAEAQRLILANDPSMANFPRIIMEGFNTVDSVISDISTMYGYDSKELGDPRKWVAIGDDKELLYPNQLPEFLRRAYCGSYMGGEYILTDDRDHNPLELMADRELSSSHSDRVGLVVLPEGGNRVTISSIIEGLCPQLNADPAHKQVGNYFISAYDKRWNGTSRKVVIDKLLKEHKRVIILTHRRFTVGVNIPQLGHIVLLDSMGSINEFEQLLGRLFRRHLWEDGTRKNITKMFVVGSGIELKAHAYRMAHVANEFNSDVTVDEYYRCMPVVLHGKTLSRDVVDIGELERAYRQLVDNLRDGRYNESLVNQYPAAIENASLHEYHDMGSDAGKKISIIITNKSGAKVKKERRRPTKPKKEQDDENEKKFGKDGKNIAAVIALIMNEINHIGFLTKSETLIDALETKQAETFFGYDNVTMVLASLQDQKFNNDAEFGYQVYCDQIRDLPFEEQTDLLFCNKEYKRAVGVVYVKQELAIEFCNKVSETIADKYNQALKSNKEFVIIVINALSGTIPQKMRHLYPKARIVCVEYFPHYIKHLQEMGFGVVDLNANVDNLTMDYMNSKLQEKIKKEGIACVLGNPPYQAVDPVTGKRLNKGTNLWSMFLRRGIDIAGESSIVSLVTPSQWTANGLFADVFSRYQTIFANIDECSKYFPGVGSKFSYYIIQKTDYTTPTTVISKFGSNVTEVAIDFRDHEKLPLLLDPIVFQIQKAVENFPGPKFTFFNGDVPAKRGTHIKDSPDKEFCYKVHNTPSSVVWTKVQPLHEGQNKVVMTTSSTYTKIYLSVNGTTINSPYYLLEDGENGDNVVHQLRSELYRFLNEVCRWANWNYPSVWRKFPKLDTSRTWTDDEIYAHIGIDKIPGAIKLIKRIIK
jgi:hypothetical protein